MIQLWPWLLLLWPLWLSRRPEAGRPLWMRRSLLLLLALLTVRYLCWRVTGSLNLTTPLAALFSLHDFWGGQELPSFTTTTSNRSRG